MFGLGLIELLILVALGSFGLLAVVVFLIIAFGGAQRRPRD
jgi:hypothetical protein